MPPDQRGIEPEMPRVNVDARAGLEQSAEREQRAGSAADRRRDRRAGDAQLRERSEPKDQTRSEHDVDRVRQPEHAHRDRRVARAAEDRVDQEQHDDR